MTLDPSLDELGPGAKEAVRQAVGAWIESGAQVPELSFDEVSTAGTRGLDGINRVMAMRMDAPGHEKDLATTFTYSDSATGAISEVDIVFNTAYDFAVVDPEGEQGGSHGDDNLYAAKSGEESGKPRCHKTFDIQNVATHEFGHFLGLGEDRTEPLATMFEESDPCQTIKRDLLRSDSDAVLQLYADGWDQEPAPGCSMGPRPHGCASMIAALGLCAVGLAASRIMRRAP